MPSEFDTLWTELATTRQAATMSARRAPNLPRQRSVYLVIDERGQRHALIRVPATTAPLKRSETQGLSISMGRMSVGSNPEWTFIDLGCVSSSQHATFSYFLEDLIGTLRTTQEPTRDVVSRTLARWRAFWQGMPVGLTREQAVGLFGELWFMLNWIRVSTFQDIEQWTGPMGSRHDFQCSRASVEVKTAVSRDVEGPVHQINGLEQLADPVEGQLYLFSLQVTDDVLSPISLNTLVSSISDALHGSPDAHDAFHRRLICLGYNLAERDAYDRPLRVLAERLFQVSDDFPRLTHDTFPTGPPNGVTDIRYKINMSACARWIVSTSSDNQDLEFLRSRS